MLAPEAQEIEKEAQTLRKQYTYARELLGDLHTKLVALSARADACRKALLDARDVDSAMLMVNVLEFSVLTEALLRRWAIDQAKGETHAHD